MFVHRYIYLPLARVCGSVLPPKLESRHSSKIEDTLAPIALLQISVQLKSWTNEL
jgi:hypothetical protein